jgi:hypothetical protein
MKPVEIRTLRSPVRSSSQGKLHLWIEVMTTTEAMKTPMLDIKPPPPEPYELRVVIWKARKITIKDTTTNQNDMFVTAQCSLSGGRNGGKRLQTDTHLRSKGGKGEFVDSHCLHSKFFRLCCTSLKTTHTWHHIRHTLTLPLYDTVPPTAAWNWRMKFPLMLPTVDRQWPRL